MSCINIFFILFKYIKFSMSLNQINKDNKTVEGERRWADQRYNNLEILGELNYKLEQAQVGQELVLGLGLEPVWVNSNAVDNERIARCRFSITSAAFGPLASTYPVAIQKTLPSLEIDTSPDDPNAIRFLALGQYLMFLKLNLSTLASSVGFSTFFERYNETRYINYFGALSRSTVVATTSTALQTLVAFVPIVITDLSVPRNNDFRLAVNYRTNDGNILNFPDSSNITIIKIS